MKRITGCLAMLAAAFWLSSQPAMAQHGHEGGGPGSAMHQPMGMDRGMSNNGATNAPDNSMARGPKTPDQLLTRNTKLSANLQALLPAGTNLQTAAASFKNLGQFVAAVHVSHNLNIPFACLASDMTGDAPTTFAPAGATPTCPAGTGTKKMNLGKSIHTLKPSLTGSQANTAAKNAERQAKSATRNSNS